MTTQLITWAAQIGGDRSAEYLIDEVREDLNQRDIHPVDIEKVAVALREVLYAERL